MEVEVYKVLRLETPYSIHTVEVHRRPYGLVLVHYIDDPDTKETIYYFEATIDAVKKRDISPREKEIIAYKNNKPLYHIHVEDDTIIYNLYTED